MPTYTVESPAAGCECPCTLWRACSSGGGVNARVHWNVHLLSYAHLAQGLQQPPGRLRPSGLSFLGREAGRMPPAPPGHHEGAMRW